MNEEKNEEFGSIESKELEKEDSIIDADENEGLEFDPTESEEFYNEIEKVLRMEEQNVPAKHIVEEIELEIDENNPMESKNTTVEMLEEEEDSIDELFEGVSAALAEQVEKEFGSEIEMAVSVEPEKEPNKFLEFWKTIPKWTKVLISVIFGILLCIGLLFGTKPGRKLIYNIAVDFVFDRINVETGDTPTIGPDEELLTSIPEFTMTPTPEVTKEPDPTQKPGETATPTPTLTPTPTPYPTVAVSSNAMKQDENIVNVLLLGEENIYGNKRGRTDAILVASLNKKTGQISLVSFLRDLYVRIPGYSDDRLNASFSHGGASLTMKTIETNFKIKLDGYVKVNFSGFENIIDKLGGLGISLTAEESEYLNTTTYISKASQRNTVPGYQKLTGSQVLGYCRVRYVPTANGLQNDFGRTYRHRVVLQALLEKYKEKNIAELLSVMNSCFSYVTASESLKEIAADCLQVVVEKRNFDIKMLQMPKSGHYSGARIQGKDVITFYPDNVDIIQEFLYGK